ncbi:enoyl-CoA hydratase-related protein [Bacteriovorax sp. PP10]|uniref:Enoyl-CoA hydratase-related protein n=1 Tax=Bacteriovorax antarcticus TaxID=3088717 RepID=A0ABU5VY81_9BACT|nr:enoyl-CoA hydratase-related protein [Bacteriovorax sp. PP10]MEA9358030.1 enoyl-CoA hydratase-related protein [Bacteriovorax sp. PP10]
MENILLEYPYKNNEHIALVRLNRPKVLNALSTDLMNELVDCMLELDQNPSVRVIILTGNERAFAAGADIAQMVTASPIDQINDNRFRTWEMLRLITKPIIAAVNGFALGGGCELAMSCDLIIAGDDAKFSQPEIKIGTIPGAGGTQRLTRAIGKSKAMMMVLTGDMIDANTACDWGLVAKVVPAPTLLQETFELAKTIADRAPVAVRLAKEAVNKSFEMTLKDGMDFERRNFYLTFSSLDQKEGMKAFMEKRSPNYQGN